MKMIRLVGILALVVGVLLFAVGMNSTDSFADRCSNFFTGHFTDSTMWYIVCGVASAIIGLMLFAFGGRRFST